MVTNETLVKEAHWLLSLLRLSSDIWELTYITHAKETPGIRYRAKYIKGKRISDWCDQYGIIFQDGCSVEWLDENIAMENRHVRQAEERIQAKRINSLWKFDEVERTLEKIGDL